MNQYKYNGWKRVTKPVAKKEYNNGNDIGIVQCGANLNSPLVHLAVFNKNDESARSSFDALVNEYEYYNCTNELGKYASFYVKDDGIKEELEDKGADIEDSQQQEITKDNLLFASLLTKKIAEKLPVRFRSIGKLYWLQTPLTDQAPYIVNSDGVIDFEDRVTNSLWVRPVIIADGVCDIGGFYTINGMEFCCVGKTSSGENILLSVNDIGRCAYVTEDNAIDRYIQVEGKSNKSEEENRQLAKQNYPRCNKANYSSYKLSDVKKFVDEWFKNFKASMN